MNPLELLILLANTVEAGAATPAQEATYLAVVTLIGGGVVGLVWGFASGATKAILKAVRS